MQVLQLFVTLGQQTTTITIMIDLKQRNGEERKDYLVRLAIFFLRENSGYGLQNDTLFYDDAECDGYCLADDLSTEFDIQED